MILSKQILVSRYSNPDVIQDYLYDRMVLAFRQFRVDTDYLQNYWLILKFKSVEFDFKNYKQILIEFHKLW
jgi:hypothetical protein